MSHYGYGAVRPLAETLRSIGLAPKATPAAPAIVKENKDEPKVDDAKAKQELIEAAKANKATETVEESTETSRDDRLREIFESVDALSKELAALGTAQEEPKNEVSEEFKEILAGLAHVDKISDIATKKFEWREDERSKDVTSLFKSIREGSDALKAKIEGGEIEESDDAKTQSKALIKRFIESIGIVKNDLGVDAELFDSLKSEVADVE